MHTRGIVGIVLLVIVAIVIGVFTYRAYTGQGGIVMSPTGDTNATSTAATSTPSVSETPPSGIRYTADGKIDTSDWVEYRSEYGGFSVRAPKERASLGCYGKECDRLVHGESFNYTLTNGFEEDIGLGAMSIIIIQKRSDTLDTWISKHIASSDEYIPGSAQGVVADTQMITVGGHTALRFDVNAPAQSAVGLSTKNIAVYPNGTPQTMSQVLFSYPMVLHGRVYVVDLGNRFALITEVLSYDKTSVGAYNNNNATRGGKAELLDDKTLDTVYEAILGSFKSFTPKADN